MNFNPSTPIYLQVTDNIKKQLVTGELSCGDKLPSGRDLALAYGINPNTAARVYQELEREGLSFTRRGLGTFITEDPERIALLKKEMAEGLIQSFLEGMQDLGFPKQDILNLVRESLMF